MLTAQQKHAMAAGRARAQKQKQREAIQRVKTYYKWLAAGSELRRIPEIPSDADFSVARRAHHTP